MARLIIYCKVNYLLQDLLPDFRGIAESSLWHFNNLLCDLGVMDAVSL